RGSCLVAPDRQYDAVQWITEQHFNETEVCEVAVETCSGTFAGFLYRMNRKLEHDTARFTNSLPHPFCKNEVMPVAWRQVAAGLGNPYDRLARLQFFQ